MGEALETFLAWKGAAVAAWLVLLFAAERLLPAAPERVPAAPGVPAARWRRWLRNVGFWAVNVWLSPLVVVPVSALAADVAPAWRPEWWSGWAGLALDVLLLDFWIYWWHRANHEVPLLWRFHEVHHLDGFLDTTSAIRFHFGEVLISAGVRAVVIIALDVPIQSVLVFEALVLMAAIFHHSNLRLPPALERGLARVVITPSIHWVHHHDRRADTDSNYGTIFSFWDPVFGTRSATRRTPDMTIGVERGRERPFAQLLLRPFRSAAARR